MKPEDLRMKAALDLFFQDYVNSPESRPYSKQLLGKAKRTCQLGLISNFTYGPVVHCSLRKLDLSKYFKLILVSEDCGWRKPPVNIFANALKRLGRTRMNLFT